MPKASQLGRTVPLSSRSNRSRAMRILTTASSGLHVAPHRTTHTVTCVLRRDPFTPPASWAYSVWVTLEDLPKTGRIAVGSVETHDVTYQMAPRPIAVLVPRPQS